MRSGLEIQVADLLTKLKVDWEYESNWYPYVIEHKYTPDFKVGDVYLECKGYFSAADRRKMKAVKKDNPKLDIRFIFQAPFNKLSKRSKTTYATWAEKNGFRWCAYYAIPTSWLKA